MKIQVMMMIVDTVVLKVLMRTAEVNTVLKMMTMMGLIHAAIARLSFARNHPRGWLCLPRLAVGGVLPSLLNLCYAQMSARLPLQGSGTSDWAARRNDERDGHPQNPAHVDDVFSCPLGCWIMHVHHVVSILSLQFGT